MMKDDFKEGDVVVLKQTAQKKYEKFDGQFSNQSMCIELINNEIAQCVWLDANKHQGRENFPINTLLKVKY